MKNNFQGNEDSKSSVKRLKKIEAIVFDMDGVLLDTESICDRTWEIAGKEFNLTSKDSERVIALCRGQNKSDTIHTLKKEFGEAFDASRFLERTSELFHEIEFSVGIKRMYWAKEALSSLKEHFPIALASSTRKESVVRQLTNAGLIEYFDVIVTGDMVVHSKPDPEIYTTAVNELSKKLNISLEPINCVAVEDSPNGLKSARDAGLTTVMIPDRIQPNPEVLKITDAVVKNLEDFTKLIMKK